jgi:hypothetical protein
MSIQINQSDLLKELSYWHHKTDDECVALATSEDGVVDYKQALMNILERLEKEYQGEIVLDRSSETVLIKSKTYKVSDLKYVIKKNGREYIALRSRIPFRVVIIFVVKQGGI